MTEQANKIQKNIKPYAPVKTRTNHLRKQTLNYKKLLVSLWTSIKTGWVSHRLAAYRFTGSGSQLQHHLARLINLCTSVHDGLLKRHAAAILLGRVEKRQYHITESCPWLPRFFFWRESMATSITSRNSSIRHYA